MKAVSAMTREVVYVTPKNSLVDAHEMMTEWNIRHLPVVEGRRLIGIISDRDVLLASSRGNGKIKVPHVSVEEVMTRAPITCLRGASITEIADLMLENKIDSIPIVSDAGELVGLVTSSDLIALLKEREEEDEAYAEIPFSYKIVSEDSQEPTAR